MNQDADTHVIPVNDDIEHVDLISCWCQPILKYQDRVTGNRVWVHKPVSESFPKEDRREQ